VNDDEVVTDEQALHKALVRRLNRQMRVSGDVLLPCVPAYLDEYMRRFAALFASLGKTFDDDELAQLRGYLAPRLEEGFRTSPQCRIRIVYKSQPYPSPAVDYTVALEEGSLADRYRDWLEEREPPLFGAHPDARVLAAAAALGAAGEAPILDVGAGTGRNALPLVRRGHPVDALEPVEAFGEVMRGDAGSLPLRVVTGGAFDEGLPLEPGRYALVVAAEVVTHFRGAAELRRFMERVARWLRPGGVLLVSSFVAMGRYAPNLLAREMSDVAWSVFFTADELAAAVHGLPLVLEADDPVVEYERAHLPEGAWPPTSWYADWAQGFDVFGLRDGRPPIELRWLAYRRS
jgi:SAM-dependent methyltransferase